MTKVSIDDGRNPAPPSHYMMPPKTNAAIPGLLPWPQALILPLLLQQISLITATVSKGPAIKKFMPLVVIIEAHDAPRNFWIW